MSQTRLAAVLLVGLWTTTDVTAADLRYFDDASLRAIQFIDAKEGWAVGDGGVWHTIDGGRSWNKRPARGRRCARSASSTYLGWAVGREELPQAAASASSCSRATAASPGNGCSSTRCPA